MEKLKNWFVDVASVMFDDSKGDFRALPKTVRLQILCTLSFLWSLLFHLLKMIMFKRKTMTMFFNRKGNTNGFLMVYINYNFSMT